VKKKSFEGHLSFDRKAFPVAPAYLHNILLL